MTSSFGQVDRVFPMLYVAEYNELVQLHMQSLLNCHLATFYSLFRLFIQSIWYTVLEVTISLLVMVGLVGVQLLICQG